MSADQPYVGVAAVIPQSVVIDDVDHRGRRLGRRRRRSTRTGRRHERPGARRLMSVRDDPTLFLQQGKGTSRRHASAGGNAITTTRVHKLDGPEHAAADDTTTLDASDDRHARADALPKLSGDGGDRGRNDTGR
jgi:hypothetical protein